MKSLLIAFLSLTFTGCISGTWKCDDQFNANDLVNNDSSWFVSESL